MHAQIRNDVKEGENNRDDGDSHWKELRAFKRPSQSWNLGNQDYLNNVFKTQKAKAETCLLKGVSAGSWTAVHEINLRKSFENVQRTWDDKKDHHDFADVASSLGLLIKIKI